jgi:hypothetical protein
MSRRRGWRWLLGLESPPAGFAGRLAPDERVLASAALPGGEAVVVTPLGIWLPENRRLGWHLVSRASWAAGVLTLVEADEQGTLGDVVLLVDRPPRQLALAEPGRIPEIVHRRVTGSIRARLRVEVPGGGAWLLHRAVPGRDGLVPQVRPDPGTDIQTLRGALPDAVAALKEDTP